MVEVFKTNIQSGYRINEIAEMLQSHFPVCKIDFDLEDCDRILRVEALSVNTRKVISLLNERGFECEELPD